MPRMQTHVGTVYGPYSGWAVSEFGINMTDGTMRVLWYNTSNTADGDAAGLWSLNSSGMETSIGTIYGSYTY